MFNSLNQERHTGQLQELAPAQKEEKYNGAARRRGGRILLSAVVYCTAGLAQAPSPAKINDPPVTPHSILAFPQRDFVSAEGYTPGDSVTVQVIHPSGTTLSSDPVTVGADGLVEVNHPGGGCWAINTPDIGPGDIVRLVYHDANGNSVADQTTVAKVTAQRPVQIGTTTTVVIHGTADPAIPLDQLEQRLISSSADKFANGRRDMRAPRDGTLSFDSPGSPNWTATYNLPATDIQRALNAESRGLWLGRDPAAGVEGTIYEIGAGVDAGPAAPCTAPLEELTPRSGGSPIGLAANAAGNNVTLSWQAVSGATGYGIYRDKVAIANVGSNQLTYSDTKLPTRTSFTYQVDAVNPDGSRSPLSDSASAGTLAVAPSQGNVPPQGGHSIISFPSRDFISADGYSDTNDKVDVYLIHKNGTVAGLASDLTPQGGLVEVNHPGGGCWNGITPRIGPGDIVRLVAHHPSGGDTIDETTTANVVITSLTAGPTTVVVKGTAIGPNGQRPRIDQIEQRFISSSADKFANGRRDLRAASAAIDGTLAYDDATSPNWTATYTGLSAADMTRAFNAQARVLWLGADPVAGTELTIFEAHDSTVVSGPGAPCTAPSEVPGSPVSPQIVATYNQPTDPTPPTTPSPVLAFNPQSVTFGTISAGTSKQQTLTIRNAGTAPVTFPTGSIALTQTDTTANVYSISAGTCTGTVQVNKTCNAIVSLNTNTRTVRKTYTGTVKVFTFSVNVTATIK